MAHPAHILPVGTQVVSRIPIIPTGVPADPAERPLHPAGVVGIITSAPADHTHAYRVRFPDNFEAALKRDQLIPLREYQSMPPKPALSDLSDGTGVEMPHPHDDLRQFIIFQCVIGSRAYGLEHESSDTDRRGIFLPPADLQWSLYGIPEQLENTATQECYWELQKFIVLALKANPNVLECLYSPIIERANPLAEELLAMKSAFLSKLAYQTYNGYVMSQFKKLSTDMRLKGEIKWKHVMHLLRLLIAGITLLKEGYVPVRIEPSLRERLLAIKRGQLSWEECNAWRLKLHEQFDAALPASSLPGRPDYQQANAFLLKARHSMVP